MLSPTSREVEELQCSPNPLTEVIGQNGKTRIGDRNCEARTPDIGSNRVATGPDGGAEGPRVPRSTGACLRSIESFEGSLGHECSTAHRFEATDEA